MDQGLSLCLDVPRMGRFCHYYGNKPISRNMAIFCSFICMLLTYFATEEKKRCLRDGDRPGWRKRFSLWLSQIPQHCADIGVEEDGLGFEAFYGDSFALVEAGVGGLGVFGGQTEEGDFDDSGGVAADAEFQEEDSAVLISLHERLIPAGGGVPACILHKGIV